MKHLSLKDALLPQPPSFVKKQLYEVHEVLGTGSFGKVVVSRAIPPYDTYHWRWLGHGSRALSFPSNSEVRFRKQHGMSPPTR